MTHIIGKHILLTAEAVLAAFPPRAEATGLPSDATHVFFLQILKCLFLIYLLYGVD